MLKKLAPLMIVLIFSGSVSAAPVDILRQQTASGNKLEVETSGEAQQATRDATADVDTYDTISWGVGSALASTCCPVGGGLVVIVIAGAKEPVPPARRLLGKTPVYINQYTATYIKRMKEERIKSTTIGCLVGSGVGMLVAGQVAAAALGGIGSTVGSCFTVFSGCTFFGF